jgi:hypothetical protein
MVVKPDYRSASRFREPSRYNCMDDASRPGANQLGPDLDCSGPMTGPRHSKCTRVFREEICESGFLLFYSHCPLLMV